ncbi:MAG: transketolase-like TK C-terminal-containing protein, partial [Actinomycetota bacterium]
IIIATGSEVSLAIAALTELQAKGIKTRVISAPCLEWFNAQPASYKDELLPKGVKARVSIEAGIAQGWRELIGDAGESISIEHFGASASHTTLFREFGFTVERVVEAAQATLKRVR